MEKMYRYLLDEIFRGVIERNHEVIKRIAAFDGDVFFRDGDLLFTLPELFKMVSSQCAEESDHDNQITKSDYQAFRNMMYQQPTNETLKKFGAIVKIETPNKNHGRTLYRLTNLGS